MLNEKHIAGNRSSGTGAACAVIPNATTHKILSTPLQAEFSYGGEGLRDEDLASTRQQKASDSLRGGPVSQEPRQHLSIAGSNPAPRPVSAAPVVVAAERSAPKPRRSPGTIAGFREPAAQLQSQCSDCRDGEDAHGSICRSCGRERFTTA